MSILNNPNCALRIGNVGTPSCAISIDHITGIIITEDSFYINKENFTSWSNTLASFKAACFLPVGVRIYPLHDIIGLTDNTPAPETKTSGYGISTEYVEKPHSFELDYKNLGHKWFAQLRNWRDRKDLRVFIIDPNFIGGQTLENGNFVGFKCTFKPKQIKVGNVADITKYTIQLDLTDPTCLTDKLDTITIPEGVTLSSELMGILDVELSTVGTPAANSINIQALTAISKTNLAEEYSDKLNVAGMWVFESNGVLKTPTAVTYNPQIKAFNFAFSAPFVGTARLTDTTALATAGIGGNGTSGFESNTLAITIA